MLESTAGDSSGARIYRRRQQRAENGPFLSPGVESTILLSPTRQSGTRASAACVARENELRVQIDAILDEVMGE